MSVAYAAPMYVGLTTILCLSYSCVECTKHKGKLDSSVKSILSTWCVIVLIVASVVGAVSGEIMVGMMDTTHLLIAAILACITISISSSMIYYA